MMKEKRAEYGEQIVSALSAQLEAEFGPWRLAAYPLKYGALCRPGSPNCAAIGCTIELDPLLSHHLPGRPAPARLLCRDVPHRALEQAHAGKEDRFHALRAHRAVAEARKTGGAGTPATARGR